MFTILRRVSQDLLLCAFAIWLYRQFLVNPNYYISNKFTQELTRKGIMSDNLVDWFKERFTPLYQISAGATEDSLSTQLDSMFEKNAHIIHNHEPIDLAKFTEGLRASSAAVVKADVEWKEVMSSVGRTSGMDQDGIVSGYFIVTRSLRFRIRVGPAQNLQHCFFSAKIKNGQGDKGEGDSGSPVISELFITSINKQAPIHLPNVPKLLKFSGKMECTRHYRLGVDVGGTNTDSVLIDITDSNDIGTRGVVASFKHTTTPDVTTGIEIAVQKVLEKAGLEQKTDGILSLTIGTTHFINAVVQSDATKLAKVAVIRLAAPYTTECPPFTDFPEHLKRIICGHIAILKGGFQINGELVNELDEEELLREAQIIREKGLKNIVIVGIYSPLDTTGLQEYRARDVLLRELGKGINIVCSRDVAQIGLLERENASILNASILPFARRTISSFRSAMKKLGLTCPLYLTQNDGTLTSASEAAKLPIRTFSSGATNSMRGAGYLAGLGLSLGRGEREGKSDLKEKEKSVIVVDIGGTTTDVGVVLPSGYPRLAGAFVQIAGVRTNFSMPDVHSIGLGGGSRVHVHEGGAVTVGPDSVGNRLEQEALVFGGSTTTTTDVLVRARHLSDIGSADEVKNLSEDVVQGGQKAIHKLLSIAIDKMKTSPEDIDVLLVGGGSIICPITLRGVSRIITPPYHDVANAIGAAIASISGDVDTIIIPPTPNPSPEEITRLVDGVKHEAVKKAVERGAREETVRVVRVDVVPLAYVANGAMRVVVKAVGELGVEKVNVDAEDENEGEGDTGDDAYAGSVVDLGQKTEQGDSVDEVDYEDYRPKVVGDEWILSETDLLFVMEGCGVLGTGGGGSPYSTYLICLEALRRGGTIRVVDHKSLPPDGFLARGAFMGSPSVGVERLRDPRHLLEGAKELAKYCGNIEFVATFSDEIGGSNGLQALALSSYLGLPAFDGDTMGRAYPRINQLTVSVYNRPNALVPCALADGNGNVVILPRVKNDAMVETIMRVITTEMGSSAALCPAPLAVSEARDYGITRCLSLAWWIGRAICICRQKNMISRVAEKILECQNGKCLFIGKIVEVSREVRAGFTWGYVRVAPLLDDEKEDMSEERTSTMGQSEPGTTLRIPFQNEDLAAYLEKEDGTQTVVASVPDLITVLDSQTGSHLGTPEYAYGLRVTVIALAGHPLWKTEVGLKVGGPEAFGTLSFQLPSIANRNRWWMLSGRRVLSNLLSLPSTTMIPIFGDETRRRINLGGASTALGRDVLRDARKEREERREIRRRQENAIKLQAWWRGISEARRTRRELRQMFEADPTSLTGLRCLVLMGHDEEVLGSWSCAMNEDVLFKPLNGKDSESWFILLRQAAFFILTSVAHYPMSQYAVAHLNVLNALLQPRTEGTQVTHSILDYLLRRNFYSLLAQAVTSVPINSKNMPSLPLIVQLTSVPLGDTQPSAPPFTSVLVSIFQQILTIPLLPNRLPIPSISFLASHLPWTHLSVLRKSIPDLVQSLSIEARIHLIANLYMFASPHIPRLPSQTVGTYLKLLSALMNSLPANALDPEAAAKKRSIQSSIGQGDPESDSDDGHGITVVAVSSFEEPSPLPKLDNRTVKRLGSIPSASHIASLFAIANKSDSVLLNFVTFLLTLVLVWPSKKDAILNTIAGLASGGIIRILYRQYVLRSQIGQSNTNLSDPSTQAYWPPLVLLTDLYSQALLTMGDDEFFSETGATRNPLMLDDLRRFSKQLLNIAVTLYWREEYTTPGQQLVTQDLKCPWETVRDKVTRCLVAIHARDSRKPFVPRDHWLVESEIDLQSFVEAAILDDRQMLSESGVRTRQLTKFQLAQMSPRLGILNNIPFAIPFETRVRIFREFVYNDMVAHGANLESASTRSSVPSRAMMGFGNKTRVQVRREMVAQDGFDRLAEADLKQPIEITFIDQFGQEEAGIDGGGVFKEFLTSLSKEVFDTDRGLWLATKKNELYPNPHTYATEPHSLNWYRFIGRMLGKAMYEGILVDVAFAGFFLSKWLGKQSFLDDLVSLDPELYNGLIFLKHYTGNPEDLSLNFTVAVDEFGVTKSIDLIPNGSETPVTKENRLTYIYLISHYRLSKQIKLQSNAFFEGLSEMIDPSGSGTMFNQQEVQILLGGVNTSIDIQDLKNNTNYGGLYDPGHPTILLFWKVVNSFSEDQKRLLLRFVSSCSRPPLLGFKELVPNFSIRDAGPDQLRLPTASTCVNLLKLPRYTSEKTLRTKLLQAITSNAGFDLS
ncbi:hypothetical protein D9756_005712 [Leucocoprinus leucothites]|uniref:HECT-type E3 ubiquitin transferase n=1 Tax=Leucocoprinus leucothites TaxID=201217 RepID=A0A8H5FZW7_9AGAR|nr:hypothetical protein D9756_005712 [Leucoagaricus leucothites]